MRLNDALLGAILLGFAGWIWWLTSFFPAFPGQDYGPNLFPRILATGIGLCALVLVLRGVRSRAPLLVVEGWVMQPARLISFLLIPLAAVAYILVSDPLGFIPTAFLLLLGLFLWFKARPVVALPVAAGMTLLVHWFFAGLMRVPLPRGILDSVL
ncbi:tripartite tricarboxylate transporter TctB family protein [Falsiroseomonas sp.]|uniref:tripartite tricarboxylate transporter TctB family protein n=1 Tax=Falsiroseomonas sp. TaxID=2870721 RepID=UPI0027169AB9|nr:tripartite tricarboxylate transporter TctB family protein [Falsiroseomonas sp.]MDO9500189.1 tripartite tricarboxylate transporter TctB family protein [Falsiroseomonas sp.]MDP3417056.1 tripartite tricarboxylate transporter TctB family protein [Falsiroseomonas sp.]